MPYKDKEKVKEYNREYYQDNKDKILERVKQYFIDNKENIKEYKKQYYQDNFEVVSRKNREWVKNNPEKSREHGRKHMRNKLRTNPKFRLDNNMGKIVWHDLKEKKNGSKWIRFVNYSINELSGHLEKLFKAGMNWDNYGSYWEVDHIIPRSKFNYTNPKEFNFEKCWALKNLQPLTKNENRMKYNKLTKPFQPALPM